MNITNIVTIISELGVLFGIIIPVVSSVKRIAEGTKCQLRSEMLRIYYHNKDSKTIRQYEYENFVMLYEAYSALKGNSFIKKIADEVYDFKVIT